MKIKAKNVQDLLRDLYLMFPKTDWDIEGEYIVGYEEVEDVTSYYSYVFENGIYTLKHEF